MSPSKSREHHLPPSSTSGAPPLPELSGIQPEILADVQDGGVLGRDFKDLSDDLAPGTVGRGAEIHEQMGAKPKTATKLPKWIRPAPKPVKPPAKPVPRSKTVRSASPKKPLAGSYLTRGYLDAGHDSVCREVACEGLATALGYCRLHYIKNWKKIKRKEVILRERKLNQYIEELISKYPDKYMEAIRQDLASDKDFAKVIYDLELDEGIDEYDSENGDQADSIIDTIKREFDDDADVF